MIYLHKILPLFISPLVIILGLLTFGIIKKRSSLLITAVLFMYVCSMPIVSGALFRILEFGEVRLEPQDAPQADAIVVLSGMLVWVPSKRGLVQEWGDPDRFFAGVELAATEHAQKLVFTGGRLPWELSPETEGYQLKKHAQRLNVPENKIIVTSEVQNTEQEAAAVKELLKESNNIILVTSAFHMKRAKHLFENAGLNVFPYPVDFRATSNALTPMDFLPDAGALGQTDTAIHEIAGIIFYKLESLLF
jgi:uncharacterized SAM-binding protein YcdF (DUF218 family)